MAGVAGQADKAGVGELFDFRPQRGEVHAVVDRHRRDTVAARLIDQVRQPGLEREQRITALCINADNGRCLIVHLRNRVAINLADA